MLWWTLHYPVEGQITTRFSRIISPYTLQSHSVHHLFDQVSTFPDYLHPVLIIPWLFYSTSSFFWVTGIVLLARI